MGCKKRTSYIYSQLGYSVFLSDKGSHWCLFSLFESTFHGEVILHGARQLIMWTSRVQCAICTAWSYHRSYDVIWRPTISTSSAWQLWAFMISPLHVYSQGLFTVWRPISWLPNSIVTLSIITWVHELYRLMRRHSTDVRLLHASSIRSIEDIWLLYKVMALQRKISMLYTKCLRHWHLTAGCT